MRPRCGDRRPHQVARLFYRDDVESGIVQIYTVEEYEKDLGSFREERTEVFTLLYPNPLEVAYAIQGHSVNAC